MDEAFFTGYCRCADGSRMVTAESGGGECSVDCGYFSCPYRESCTIAAQIWEFLKESASVNRE